MKCNSCYICAVIVYSIICHKWYSSTYWSIKPMKFLGFVHLLQLIIARMQQMVTYNQNFLAGMYIFKLFSRCTHISLGDWVSIAGYSVTSQNIQVLPYVYALGLSGIALMPVLQLLWNLYLHRYNQPTGQGWPFVIFSKNWDTLIEQSLTLIKHTK